MDIELIRSYAGKNHFADVVRIGTGSQKCVRLHISLLAECGSAKKKTNRSSGASFQPPFISHSGAASDRLDLKNRQTGTVPAAETRILRQKGSE